METSLPSTCSSSITVWFVCNSCEFTFYFRNVDEFLDHKRENHVLEFQQTKSIVFEERKNNEIATINDTAVTSCENNDFGNECEDTKLFTYPITITVPAPALAPVPSPVQEISLKQPGPAGDDWEYDPLFTNFEEPEPDFDEFPSAEAESAEAHDPSTSSSFNTEKTDGIYDANKSTLNPIKIQIPIPIPGRANSKTDESHKYPIVLLKRLSRKEIDHLSKSFKPISASTSTSISIHQRVAPSPSPQSHLKSKLKSKSRKKPGGKSAPRRPKQTSLVCKICSKTFKLNCRLRAHIKLHGLQRLFKCPLPHCVSSFKTKRTLKSHLKTNNHTGKLPQYRFEFPAPVPVPPDSEEAVLPLKQWLQAQVEKEKYLPHTSESEKNIILLDPDPLSESWGDGFKIGSGNPITCRLCCTQLESEPELQIHVTHCWLRNKTKHRYCVLCEKKFADSATLRYHIDWSHGSEGERAAIGTSCELCGKIFRSKYRLQLHTDSHKSREDQTRTRNSVCEICGAAFRAPYLLRAHHMTHTSKPEDRPYKCPHPNCPKAYVLKTRLDKHMVMHSDTKPFKCPFQGCGKEYRYEPDLVVHERNHTGERPFQCDLCGKAYATRQGFKSHSIAVHGASA